MKTINLVGYGNVGQHIANMFSHLTDFQLQAVYTRTPIEQENLPFENVLSLDEMPFADLTIISVKDDAIAEISTQLPYKDSLVVHTSGSQPMEILSSKNRKGVWYPLQTFSKEKTINYAEISFFLEVEYERDRQIIEHFTKSISSSYCFLNSQQRKQLHITAVFACNFVNHLWTISEDIASKNQIPFQFLHPLIKETVDKIQYLSPKQAQTGPAVRKDLTVIEKHLQTIENESYKEIYKLLTNSIIQTHEL
ncbi:Rossmann-like and DUF2520 domain-containing protein [Capnocytophaga sp. ARDL2]|uniref:Rossmann-like and DUF2520 domain-containing protein n=1 Tax=Capnocytophaga sp. ARDL2 TaxID=3238809 RepID=UPI0035580C77